MPCAHWDAAAVPFGTQGSPQPRGRVSGMDNRTAHRLRLQLRVSMDSPSPMSIDLMQSVICWGYFAIPARLSYPQAISGGSEVKGEQHSLGIRNG